MLEPRPDQRVIFKEPGMQRQWLAAAFARHSLRTYARICSRSERTVRDWYREKFHMDVHSAQHISAYASLPLPRSVSYRDTHAHVVEAGSRGGRATIRTYGKVPVSETYRKKQWHTWWEQTGHNTTRVVSNIDTMTIPKRGFQLAEFMGIMIGDGSLSPYHANITLNSITDRDYSIFVIQTIKKLFGITPHVYARKHTRAIAITISRKACVTFLHTQGLPIGNKLRQNITIPEWIRKNPSYARACLRGLIDTDGTVFTHTYTVKGRTYAYKKISFSSASPQLCSLVQEILAANHIRASLSGTNVRIDAQNDVRQYWSRISSHNPKHLKRALE